MINVALADDHVAMRKGLKYVIEAHDQIKVVLEAGNGEELLKKLNHCNYLPDIVLLDINMPVMDGKNTLDVLKLKWPRIRVIMYSFYAEDDTVKDMIHRGASAYINKGAQPDILCRAILDVKKTGFYIGEQAKKEYFESTPVSILKRNAFYGRVTLTVKEVEFIRLSATDFNYKQIASIMGVSPKTVENYRDNLLKKLHLKNRISIVIYGIVNGIITLSTL